MVNPFVSQWIVKQYISKENWIHVLEEELQYIYFEFFQVGQKAYLIPINTEPKDHGIYAVQYEFEIDLFALGGKYRKALLHSRVQDH